MTTNSAAPTDDLKALSLCSKALTDSMNLLMHLVDGPHAKAALEQIRENNLASQAAMDVLVRRWKDTPRAYLGGMSLTAVEALDDCADKG